MDAFFPPKTQVKNHEGLVTSVAPVGWVFPTSRLPPGASGSSYSCLQFSFPCVQVPEDKNGVLFFRVSPEPILGQPSRKGQ